MVDVKEHHITNPQCNSTATYLWSPVSTQREQFKHFVPKGGLENAPVAAGRRPVADGPGWTENLQELHYAHVPQCEYLIS